MAKDRTILYIQKVINDPGNAKSAQEQIRQFKEVEAAAKAAKKATDEAMKASRSGAAAARSSSAGRGARGGFAAGYDKAEASARKQAMADERRERELNLRESLRSYDLQEKAAAKAAATAKRHNNELLTGLKQAAVGVGNVARAFVYLGVSGEENLARAVQMLAKFEAGMAGIRGVADIAAGGAKAIGAYRGLQAGAGLAAGVGAVGLGSTLGLSVAAGAVGAGVGFGIGRAAIGGESFGRMTDNWGITNYAGDRRAAVQGRNAVRANQLIAQRGGIDQRYSDFNQTAAINLQYAEATGGLFGAKQQAMTNADLAFARQRDLNGGAGMAPEIATRELANANASRVQAMSTIVSLQQQELSLVNQGIAAEKQRTQAIKDQQQAIKASVGLADSNTLREAEAGAKAIREGRLLTQSQASAVSQFAPEAGQAEAAKLGEKALGKNTELAALIAQELRKAEEKNKAMSIAIEQKVTGRITVTPDLEKTKTDIEAILKQWSEETRDLMQKQLELDRADRNSQDALQSRTRS